MDAATMSAAHTNVVEKYSAVKANIAKKKENATKSEPITTGERKLTRKRRRGTGVAERGS